MNATYITKVDSNRQSRPTILIVEDSLVCQRLTELQLDDLGYNHHTVANGSDAILAIETWPKEGRQIDLILLDIGLPDMSGIELCKRLAMRGCTTPIIVVSAHADDQIYEIIGAGASKYLPKPVMVETLHAAIKELIGA